MQLTRYTSDRKEEWDEFVNASRNATFILQRNYIDYQESRLEDHSLLFYNKKKLVAVLPGNVAEGVYYSHWGVTYGGLIMAFSTTAGQVLTIFDLFLRYLASNRIANRVVYRAIPYIYHKYPAQDDLYALFRNGFVLTERKLSSAIFQQNALPFRELRVRKIKLASQNELVIQYNTGLRDFWEILEGILWNKYNTRPVHTPEEMELLQAQFPQNIHLHTVCSNNCVLAGCVVYETSEVAHIQYIASNDEGKSMGALDLLFDYLINKLYIEKRYIDFGVSVEQGGWFLNEGLLFQKEGFGARSIVYDTYELEINRF